MTAIRLRLRRFAVLVPLLSIAVVLGALVTAPAAVAAGGTWGAGAYPYVAGRVCSSGAQTVPYVAWNVSAPTPDYPAYLTAPVVSDGTTDSGAPPLAKVGPGTVTPVSPGMFGFGSATDIAVYARLLASADSSGGTEGAAEAAEAIIAKASGQAPLYCGGDPSGAVAAADATAGPYTVTVSAGAGKAVPTQSNPVTATVRSGTGNPVPGVTVTLTSSNATIAPSTDVTDSTGTAQFSFRPPAGQATPVTLQASVSAPTGLEVVQTTTAPSATNPTGHVVAAILPAPPSPTTGSVTVAVDNSAAPVVHAHGSVGAITLQGTVAPTADVTGLRGHSATLSFTVYGPAALDPKLGCQKATFSASSPVAATTSPQTFTGDRTVTAQPWTPTAAGCYSVGASLQTLNATPQATATSSPADPDASVAVVDVTATLATAGPVAGKGKLTATVTLARTAGAPATLGGRLAGPVPPATDGTCTGVKFANAPDVALAGSTHTGDGPVTLTSGDVGTSGCYDWQPSVTLAYPGIDLLTVPVTSAAPAVLVIAPILGITVERSWSTSPEPVRTVVQVSGLYHATAHVAIRMVRVAQPYTGCVGVSFAGATTLSTGPSTAISGDGTFPVVSGSTPQSGCYEPVPQLTVDDVSPAITLDAPIGNPLTVINVGSAVSHTSTAFGRTAPDGDSHLAVWITLLVTALFEVLTVAGVVVFARRRRSSAPEGAPLRLM